MAVMAEPSQVDLLQARMETSDIQWTGHTGLMKFQAMGTLNEITFCSDCSEVRKTFPQETYRWLGEFEARYSRFIPSSLVSRINQAGGQWVALDSPLDHELFSLCDWFHWKTQAVFDPTGGSFLRFWDYQQTSETVPTPSEVAEILPHVGWSRVEHDAERLRLPHEETRIDFGGIGKEFAVDKIADLAEQMGISNYLINFGRDIRCAGHPPGDRSWRIGLELPDDAAHCWGGVGLSGQAIASSGNNQRYREIKGQKFGHLLDPRSGWPAQSDCEATWVVAPTCTEAGVLSTSAYILGHHAGLALMQESPHTCGAVWAQEQIHITERFNRYVLEQTS